MALNSFFLLIGLTLLFLGSDWLVRGASNLAFSLSIRPIIIGLTVVAFATSAPELLVSLVAATKGSSGLSVGNILGSNVINIALVLGSSALVKPLKVNKKIVSKELPYMIGASFLFWFLCLDGKIGRIDGLILLGVLAVFIIYGIMTARDIKKKREQLKKTSLKNYAFNGFLILTGLVCLWKGSDFVVNSAVFIARSFGFSELFIGLSIVAFGTSLPELATSVVAVSKDESDISLGNVVGSNLFNICMVMGTVGLLNPISIDSSLNRFEFPAMLFLPCLLLIFSRSGYKINRSQGLIFILSFFLYVGGSYWMVR